MTTSQGRFPILLSVVMVVDGWADQAASVVAQVAGQVEALVADYEIILVDNGSQTAHPAYKAMTGVGGEANVQVFRLVQQVGIDVAAWAGVENSLGDFVLVFAPFNDTLAPLRDALYAAMRGIDLVLMVNTMPRQSAAARRLRNLYTHLFRTLSGVHLEAEAASYRLFSKRVVTFLIQQTLPSARYRTLPALAGFAKRVVCYSAPRTGDQRLHLRREIRRGFDLLISNSLLPLRLASTIGLMGAILNICYSIYVVVVNLLLAEVAAGWTTLSLQQSGMFFLLSVIAFVLTEYFIHDLRNSRGGPSYFVVEEMTSAVLTRRLRLNVETTAPTDCRSHSGE